MFATPLTDQVLNSIQFNPAYPVTGNEGCVEATLKHMANGVNYVLLSLAYTVAVVCTPFFLAVDFCAYLMRRSHQQPEENEIQSSPPNSRSMPRQEPCSLIDFYLNRRSNDQGVRIEDVWRYDNDQLERHHLFIQWLFPKRVRGNVNPTAPVVTDAIRAEFRRNPQLQANLLRSLNVMLRFYGFERNERTGEITRSRDFDVRSRNWLTRGNHNFLRLDRMIRSLGLLGRAEDAKQLYRALENLYIDRQVNVIQNSLQNFWRQAVLEIDPRFPTRV